MSDINFEQLYVIGFCFGLGHSETETFAKLHWGPTEAVFCQGPSFFPDGLRRFREESRLKTNHAVEGLHLQKPMKIATESQILTIKMIGQELKGSCV